MSAYLNGQKVAVTLVNEVENFDKTEAYNIFANTLKGSKSGEIVSMTDVSPIEHNIGVKVSGVEDLTAVTLKKCGKNLIKPVFTSTTSNGVTRVNNADGTVTVSGIPTTTVQFGILPAGTKLPKGKYRFSALPFATTGSSDLITADIRELGYNESTGSYSNILSIEYDSGNGVTFNKTKDDTDVRIYIKLMVGYNGDEVTLYPQVEHGTVKTAFEPYIEPIEYTPNVDGTVDGVKSLYPTTTLLTDTAGVIIEAEYNRDINKAFAEITQVLTSLGGNV